MRLWLDGGSADKFLMTAISPSICGDSKKSLRVRSTEKVFRMRATKRVALMLSPPSAKNDESLEQVVKGYKVFYQKVPGKDPKYYTIDHTAGSYVIDQKGQLRLFVTHNQGEKALAEDLKQLIDSN